MRDVRGGPDVIHVFAHTVASLDPMPGLWQTDRESDILAERALLLALSDDIVCVSEPVDAGYLEFLADLGLGSRPERVVVDLAAIRGLVDPARRVVLNPYIATAREFQMGETLAEMLGRPVEVLGGNPELIARANLKHVARAKAVALGVPVAPGEVVDRSAVRDALVRQLRATGRAIIRGSRGASGSATFVAEDNADSIEAALRWAAVRSDNTVYLVEVMFEAVASPNVLMHVEPDNGRVRCVGISDQRLDANLSHAGNAYPSLAITAAEMIASARELSGWLQSEGFTGLAGFDFVEYREPRTNQRRQFLAEINARTNAAAYSKAAMDRLNAGAFVAVKEVLPEPCSFGALRKRCAGLLFDPRMRRGMLPYATGLLALGKLYAVFLGATREEAAALYEEYRGHCKSGNRLV